MNKIIVFCERMFKMESVAKNWNPLYKTMDGEREIMALYDSVLQNWLAPFTTVLLPTRHGDTFVIESGEKKAPPLILLHGAASNAVSWIGDVAEYSKHFRVFAVDIIGNPGKSAPTRPAWDGPGYAEWLEDVVDGLKLDKASLLGLSQGGWTALKFAAYRPERVTKLVLLAPAGIIPARGSFLLKAIFYTMLGRWGADRLNRYIFGKQPMDPLAVKFMNSIMTHFNARVEKEYIFSDEELMRLKMPVLFIGGQEDVIQSIKDAAARLEKLLPDLHSIIIPDIGHVLVNTAKRVIPFLLQDILVSTKQNKE